MRFLFCIHIYISTLIVNDNLKARPEGYQVKKPYILETRDMVKEKPDIDQKESSRIRELEKQLEMARLEAAAYRKMIEIAEDELKIEIRKKSDTTQ